MPTAAPDRLAVLALCALLFAQTGFVWRLERHPRRNAVQVASRAVASFMPAYLLSSMLIATILLSARMTGLWPDAGPSLVYFIYLAALGAVVAPPYMVALGAAFGRAL